METEWIAARGRLRHLMQEQPDGSIRDLHRQLLPEIGHCFEWVRKWYHRLKECDPNDPTILLSRSRRRKTPYERISEAVEAKIIDWRDRLTEQYNRRVGARNILYHLQRDEQLRWSKAHIPTSTSTITRILHKYQRIPRQKPPIHTPRDPSEPMQVWEIDWSDVITAHSDETHKTHHQVESFHVVDVGTSISIALKVGDDFHAETMITVMTDVFMMMGLPKTVRMDRDPRLIGSWGQDKFPSAFMRFLLCLGVQLDVCPARRPDLKPYVERFIRSWKEECVYKIRPCNVRKGQQAADDYSIFYNLERPNQAITCGNHPPAVALEHPPYLPRLPQMIDPDTWLKTYHGRTFRRRVRSNGSVMVDKQCYYVGVKHKGQRVLLRLEAETQQFAVLLSGQVIKTIAIKGLYHGEMEFADYLELIRLEAQSETRRLQYQRRAKMRYAA
jgi:hypothetical protein